MYHPNTASCRNDSAVFDSFTYTSHSLLTDEWSFNNGTINIYVRCIAFGSNIVPVQGSSPINMSFTGFSLLWSEASIPTEDIVIASVSSVYGSIFFASSDSGFGRYLPLAFGSEPAASILLKADPPALLGSSITILEHNATYLAFKGCLTQVSVALSVLVYQQTKFSDINGKEDSVLFRFNAGSGHVSHGGYVQTTYSVPLKLNISSLPYITSLFPVAIPEMTYVDYLVVRGQSFGSMSRNVFCVFGQSLNSSALASISPHYSISVGVLVTPNMIHCLNPPLQSV